jgi:hypothetical protein
MAWRWEALGGVAVGKTLAEDANEFNGLEQRSSDQDPASRALMKELRSKNRSGQVQNPVGNILSTNSPRYSE